MDGHKVSFDFLCKTNGTATTRNEGDIHMSVCMILLLSLWEKGEQNNSGLGIVELLGDSRLTIVEKCINLSLTYKSTATQLH
jgi:hypothetical protein